MPKPHKEPSMSTKVHCCHILVKTQTEANAVKARLDKGEKFGEVAKQVSLCPSGKKGGDLGTFTRGKMVKEFEKAAFALEKGQVSGPVKTQYGYHIIKRIE
jgi:parvulin-like peptidyl-prolyl isomerase